MRRWRLRVGLCLVSLCLVAFSSSAVDWPEFRGPFSNGHAAETTDAFPVRWSETENVTWKTAIPLEGWSTPVVMNGEIWLTTATSEGTDFFAIGINADSGEIFYNERLFHSDNPEPLGNNVNRYASPSPAIEPGRVYIHFGSYGTACIDTHSRNVLWRRTDLECRHYRGPGSSVFLFENLVVLTFDGVDRQYMVALDKSTGETKWRTDRSTVWTDLDANGQPERDGDARKSFSTPVIANVGGQPVLVNVASYNAFGYHPRTGRELWKIQSKGYTASTRPVLFEDLAIIATGYGVTELRGIRLDGAGDVTESHIAWRHSGPEVPDTPSPIVVDDLLYAASDRGALTCFDARSGTIVWAERAGGSYVASPIYAGGRLYFPNVQGKTLVLKPGRTFEAVAENELSDGMMASPAAAGDSLYLRTKTHLYGIDAGH